MLPCPTPPTTPLVLPPFAPLFLRPATELVPFGPCAVYWEPPIPIPTPPEELVPF